MLPSRPSTRLGEFWVVSSTWTLAMTTPIQLTPCLWFRSSYLWTTLLHRVPASSQHVPRDSKDLMFAAEAPAVIWGGQDSHPPTLISPYIWRDTPCRSVLGTAMAVNA